MLNIYEGVLKLVNPKLYNSSYKINVIQVLNVLREYKFRHRIIYLKNLSTLKIKKVSLENLKKIGIQSNAIYYPNTNKIYLPKEEKQQYSTAINHELFHVASSRNNNHPGVIWRTIGGQLTEGITEYLSLKSENKKISISGYQLELFVVEFLIFIFGEEIIEPYLENNGKKFFEQFDKFYSEIIKIEEFLSLSSINDEIQLMRLFYLCLTDRIPNKLKDDEEFLRKLNLDDFSLTIINYHISNNEKTITDNIEQFGEIDFISYQFNNETKKNVYEYFIADYDLTQTVIFEEILTILIEIAKQKGFDITNVNNFIQESFCNKNEDFNTLYKSIINKLIDNHKMKR